MKKLPISVCVISGAEAHRIGRALASVADWVSEIIVVLNDDVRDGTEEIARKYGAQVYREPWKGFIGQKNSAVAKATQPWVFGLDCDEEVSKELQDELQSLFTMAPPSVGYSSPRCSEYFGRWIKHGDWYPDRCVRLWKRGEGKWAGADPHAKPEVNGPIGALKSELRHYPSETINHQILKTISYADDFVRHCQETGKKVTLLDLVVRPPWRFVRGYIFRLGFLDGWQGYSIAWLTSFYTFLRYAKAREAQLRNRQVRE